MDVDSDKCTLHASKGIQVAVLKSAFVSCS